MFVYMNGTFVEAERASISPFDHGFLYGLGAFETFRTYGGQPFLLEEHLERLNAALRELQIERRFSGKEVLGITEELIKLNGL
ncbi:MAG TPA: aminotransferase class IV, partial [Bacillaceae bacterium]